MAVKSPKSAKFDHTNHILARPLDPVHPIWTKFGMDIVLDPNNKPAEESVIYCKVPDGGRRRYGKLQNWP